ncbi:unnamed protein product [Larinioides sclopetarius]|uniref:Uncharacterized protein n=1 Tax=Larinioides sclopetarius TaxID=280406 RepID=A0AAV1YWW5_9ARAC
MQKLIALILLAILVEIFLSVGEVYEGVPDVEDWKSDYELWDNRSGFLEEQELWENDNQSNLTSWKLSHEDEILYDIYSRQPEDEVEEIDEDGVELSDDWLVLDIDEDLSKENDREMVNDIEASIDHVEVDDSMSDKEQNPEILDCEDETPKPMKRKKKILNRKPKPEEFYFKHKKYGGITFITNLEKIITVSNEI